MESKIHHNLVKKIYNYVCSFQCIENALVESDIYEIKGNVTRMPEGYVADVYYNYKNIIIIGEAKSEKDLETSHSIEQYKSYIKYLNLHASNGKKCILIIATPWQASISAYKILKTLINKKIKLIIVNEVGVYKEYEKN